MIQLQDFALRRGGRLLFEKATFQIHPGWKVGLTGVNGAGKSTLFAAFMGEMAADVGNLSRPATWTVAHMAQEVESQETAAIDFVLSGDEEWWTINQQLEHESDTMDLDRLSRLHERFGEIDGYTATARAAQMMAGLGFTTVKQSASVSSFSGGWRMRLNLARTLMSRSDLLLLDEPTNHLDLDAILWLEDWLKNYPGTLILISHDRDFLDAITDHIIHIEAGLVTLYTGNYSTFEQTRAERLSQQQISFEKQEATRAHLQKYIDRFSAQATRAKQAQSRVKQLERMQKLAPAHVDTPFTFSFREPSKMSSPLLQLDEVDAGYNTTIIVNNIRLQLTPDSRIGLLGMNGAGKSTLIKTLAGVIEPLSGERTSSEHLNLGYFAQHQMDALDADASPMLQLGRLAGKKISDAELRAYLGSFGFSGERMDTVCGSFSGGERARLALALIVWQRPNVLVLDEPTNHLDLDMRHALTLALQDFKGAVVLVSHERQLIASVCDDLLLVHGGVCRTFDGDLADYAQWLKLTRQQEMAAKTPKPEKTLASKSAPTPAKVEPVKETVAAPSVEKSSTQSKPIDKELARKEAAAKREQTRPLRSKIEKAEKEIKDHQAKLKQLEEIMADTGLYEASRKAELLKLMEQQQQSQSAITQLDESLLEMMMQLDELESP